MKLSIVMPSFNQARFLAEAVHSVLGQDLREVELLVQDGGSGDGTVPLLQELERQYPGRLKWLSAADDGPAQAVNRAAARASAPVLGWLNSDDRFTRGALARALDAFTAAPGLVLVYGEAQHVDVAGVPLGRYPSLAPEAGIGAFRDGCFICQPTAFFRRESFLELGGLDETLGASFDLDLWLRYFRAHRGRIGFVDALQAQSRLHEGGITLRERERVAREGIRVLARHLGSAPGHWLLTHFEELLAIHPFHPQPVDLRLRTQELFAELSAEIDPADHAQINAFLQRDRRLALAQPCLGLGLHADGWAGERLEIRIWQPPQPFSVLRLHCRHASPLAGQLRLSLQADLAPARLARLEGNAAFTLEVPLAAVPGGEQWRCHVLAEDCFVPADCEPGSGDGRRLAYRVEAAELLR